MFAIQSTFDHALPFQSLEARGEGVRGHSSQRVLKILKATGSLQEQIPEYEDGPSLTDDVQCSSDWALQLTIRLWHTRQEYPIDIVLASYYYLNSYCNREYIPTQEVPHVIVCHHATTT